jgi:immune inhibitor A
MKNSWLVSIIILSIITICVCLVTCGALATVVIRKASTGSLANVSLSFGSTSTVDQLPPTPVVIRPSEETPPGVDLRPTSTETNGAGIKPAPTEMNGTGIQPAPSAESPTPTATLPADMVKLLNDTILPTNDPILLAQRLGVNGQPIQEEIPRTIDPPTTARQVGENQNFWVINSDTNKFFQVSATLQHVTEHSYFWIEDGVQFNRRDLKQLARTFEDEIYPTTRNLFGSEWTPGVDGDPHLYILFARDLGETIAGYFSTKDEYPPIVSKYSNAHEMFLLSADGQDLGDEYAYTVLAHELQHMIHWNMDRNEEVWVDEGLSELSSFISGYGVGFHDYSYVEDPDIQLTDLPEDDVVPHYGASFLFFNYFLNRFGEESTRLLVRSELDGLASVDQFLVDQQISDPLTGSPIRADDVFADWTLATYLMDESVADGRYTLANYPHAPQTTATETFRQCPLEVQTRDVSQYGVDYYQITCRGDFTLHFEGSTQVAILPTDPRSGSYYFWSNRGEESDTTLTRAFDFSKHNGALTFSYSTWYDLEQDYDYAYLEVSTDGGKTWKILNTPSGTADNPAGSSYGWGYNGKSGNSIVSGNQVSHWITETVDLSAYAGKKVLLRFEYITDAAVNGEGLVLDDLSIPEIGYTTDLETDDGGWQADGFVRIQNVLPQTYRLAIIRFGKEITVEKFILDGNNQLDIPLSIRNDVDEIVLVVSGTAPFSRQKTGYRFELIR